MMTFFFQIFKVLNKNYKWDTNVDVCIQKLNLINTQSNYIYN